MAESSTSKAKISNAKDTMDTLFEISKLLNTGLDAESLATCVRLCESGVNPEALALIIQELRRESTAMKYGGETCMWTCNDNFCGQSYCCPQGRSCNKEVPCVICVHWNTRKWQMTLQVQPICPDECCACH